MPLSKSDLESQLTSLFSAPPDNRAACAPLWGDAMKAYAVGMIPAHIAATLGTSATTLGIELVTVFDDWWAANDQASLSIDPLETAFADFATRVKDSADDAGLYEGLLAPPAPVGFSSLYTIDGISTPEAAAAAFAEKIDTWMKTGTSKLILTPFTEVNWA